MTPNNAVRLVVVGQGYVGLPLAVAAAEVGHAVWGVDLDKVRVDTLQEGISPVGDVASARLQTLLESGRYRATQSFECVKTADVVILCVPTPYHNDAPDLSFVEVATREVAARLQPGALVILESTTYPGTTEEVVAPILEEGSGLRVGEEFDLVFSPERIDPGNERFTLANTPKIVGGTTARATERAAAFYGTFVQQVVTVSSPKTAEMAKLLENTFRHINIALVNEIAMLAQDMGIDVWEAIDAAASKPFGFMPFYPGPGVGGHCIPVDPMYLSWRVKQFGGAAKFIELARDVNAAMPLYCVTRVTELLNERERAMKGSRILIVGVAYKPNIGDMRESPALPLIERLVQKGAAVTYHDPFVPTLRIGQTELRSVDLDEAAVRAVDCVCVVTNHADVDYGQLAEWASLVYDTRNCVPAAPHVHRL